VQIIIRTVMVCSTFYAPTQGFFNLFVASEPHALIHASNDVRKVEATGCLRTHFLSRAKPLWGRQSKQRWPIL